LFTALGTVPLGTSTVGARGIQGWNVYDITKVPNNGAIVTAANAATEFGLPPAVAAGVAKAAPIASKASLVLSGAAIAIEGAFFLNCVIP
jgi:hypothetical protein